MCKVNVFKMLVCVISVFALGLCSNLAIADWDTTTPNTKWVQLPDEYSGIDVNATYANTGATAPVYPWQKILADDFPCYQTGPITDIHIWGSWLNDNIPLVTGTSGLQNVSFKLSIHSDVPADSTNTDTYSYPGEKLWSRTFIPGEYTARLWKDQVYEYFYEPNELGIIGTDTQIWQYNFNIDPTVAFSQLGTSAAPMIYWLDVQAIIPEAAEQGVIPEYVFGWKTTDQPWHDDAVYGDTQLPGGEPYPQFPDPSGTGSYLPWKDMIYPIGPYQGQSLNLAFAITTIPEPGTIVMLLGACLFAIAACTRRR